MTDSNKPGRTLTTTKKSLKIVETLQEMGTAQVSKLAEELDMSVSTVHHHIATLQEAGYVNKENESYRLSWKFLTLTGKLRMKSNHYRKISNKVNELAYETSERAQFVVEEGGKGVWITTSLGPDAILTDIRAGLREPLHTIAAGKAILAQLPEQRIEEIFESQGLASHTDNTVTTREQIISQLEEVRQDGFAVNNQERIELETGIGVPLMNSNTGELLGAMSISAPHQRWNTDETFEEHADLLLEAKSELELSMAYE